MKSSPKIALIVAGSLNFMMGFVEIVASFFSSSSALFADSLDFFVDGANYFSSFFILKKSKRTHQNVWKIKGYLMIVLGTGVLVWACWKYMNGWIPDGEVMTAIGFLALVVNLLSTWLLQKFQNNSLDLRAVWLCTRNDAIGNILIIIAGYWTLRFASPIPDILVSLFMGVLIFRSGVSIVRGGHDAHDHAHH
jgi:Co/Zn/Cd efflux system component